MIKHTRSLSMLLAFHLFISPHKTLACGYDYVSTGATTMEFSVNGQWLGAYVYNNTWMVNFHNYNFWHEWISRETFAGINQVSTKQPYNDFTAIVGSVVRSQSYPIGPFSVSVGTLTVIIIGFLSTGTATAFFRKQVKRRIPASFRMCHLALPTRRSTAISASPRRLESGRHGCESP